MADFFGKLSGKKTYILVALGCILYVAGITDMAPFPEETVNAKDLGTMLWGLALATIRSGMKSGA